MMRLLFLLLLLISLVTLSGCSSGGSESSAEPSVETPASSELRRLTACLERAGGTRITQMEQLDFYSVAEDRDEVDVRGGGVGRGVSLVEAMPSDASSTNPARWLLYTAMRDEQNPTPKSALASGKEGTVVAFTSPTNKRGIAAHNCVNSFLEMPRSQETPWAS